MAPLLRKDLQERIWPQDVVHQGVELFGQLIRLLLRFGRTEDGLRIDLGHALRAGVEDREMKQESHSFDAGGDVVVSNAHSTLASFALPFFAGLTQISNRLIDQAAVIVWR